MSPADDRWAAGDAYETFMGRWSRRLADSFIRWLEVGPGLTWLDVGCGTGALASTICRVAAPAAIVACDPSGAFVEHVRSRIAESRISVVVAGAGGLPERPGGFDCVVPQPHAGTHALCGGDRVRNALETMTTLTWSPRRVFALDEAQIDDLAGVLIDCVEGRCTTATCVRQETRHEHS